MKSRYTVTSIQTGKNLAQIHATGCSHIAKTYASAELTSETLEGAIAEVILHEFDDGDRGGREEIKIVACAKKLSKEES